MDLYIVIILFFVLTFENWYFVLGFLFSSLFLSPVESVCVCVCFVKTCNLCLRFNCAEDFLLI